MTIKVKIRRWWKWRVRAEARWRWHRVNRAWGDFWEGFFIDYDYWVLGIEPTPEPGDRLQWWFGGPIL